MSYFNLAALDAASLNRDPYDYLVVPDFLTVEGLAAANRDYPEISTAGNKDLEALHYGPGFRALIEELNALAIHEDLTYRHRWTPGQMMVWDNRCVQHRATEYDPATQRRVIRRCTVLGEAPK